MLDVYAVNTAGYGRSGIGTTSATHGGGTPRKRVQFSAHEFFFSIFCVRPGTLNPPHYSFSFGAISLSLFFSAFFSCAISSFLLYLLFCFVLRGILDVTVCFVLQTYKQLRCTFGASHVCLQQYSEKSSKRADSNVCLV